MRRALLLLAVFGLVAGAGCRHMAGRCDCTADAGDAVLPVPSNPYPAVGQPIPGAPVAGPAVPAEKMPLPPMGK